MLMLLTVCIVMTYSASALGVAHQALEEINPAGDNILIQGAIINLSVYIYKSLPSHM